MQAAWSVFAEQELAATSWLGRNPVGTREVGDGNSVDIVVLANVNIGLLVVLDGLRIQAVYRSVKRSEGIKRREIIRDMYAVQRRRFESYHKFSKILTGTQVICKPISKFHCAVLIIADREALKRLLGFKIQERDNVAAGADVNPDKKSRKKIRLLQSKPPPFRLSVGKVNKELS